MTDHPLIHYYRLRAPEYEAIYYRDTPARNAELHAAEAGLVQRATGQTVCEFACGTGYWTAAMSQSAQSIVALDAAPEMIAEAQRKDFGCPVELRVADMFAWIPPQRYDLVVLGFWFSHHPRQNYAALFDVLFRAIKPGGLIWMIDNNPPAEGPSGDTVSSHSAGIDADGNNLRTRRLDDGAEHTIIKNYFTELELRSAIEPHAAIRHLTYGDYYWTVGLEPII